MSLNVTKELVVEFLKTIPDNVVLISKHQKIVWATDAALIFFGRDNLESFNAKASNHSPQIQPNGMKSVEMFEIAFNKALEEEEQQFKWLFLDSSENELPSEVHLKKVQTVEGDFVIAFIKDLRNRFGENFVKDKDDYYFPNRIPEKTFFELLSKLSDDFYFIIDRRHNKIRFFKKNIEIIGDRIKEAYNVLDAHEDDLDIYNKMVNNMSKGIVEPIVLRFLQPDGTYKYNSLSYENIFDENGTPIMVVGKAQDIHEQKMLEEKAKLDSLTQCYSRNNFVEIINKKIEKGGNNVGALSALVILDINTFRYLNEKKGYYYGDEVLRAFANKIKFWADKKGVAGRLSNDTFAVFVDDVGGKGEFEAALNLLLENTNGSYNVFGEQDRIKISIGVAYGGENCKTYSEYIKRAAKALYASRVSGGENWKIFEPSYENYDLELIKKEKKAEGIFGTEINYKLISAIFNILDERDDDSLAINEALKYIGQVYNVDRCFISETFDDGKTYEVTHGWMEKEKGDFFTLGDKIPSNVFQEIFDKSSSQGVYVWQDNLEDQFAGGLGRKIREKNIKSILHVQMNTEDYVSLFLRAESFNERREWTDEEGNTLYYLLKIFSIILHGKSLYKEVQRVNERSKITAYIGDNTDNFIYIVDPETFKLLHMNQKALIMYGLQEEEEWKDKKCYQVLHGKSAPCEFCTNKYTTENEFYEWNYYNPKFDKTYLFKDKLIPLNGKMVKLQVATDVTKLISLENELTNRIEEQSFLLNCIKLLHSNDSPDESITKILHTVCSFFDSTKGVLIRLVENENKAIKSHEWEDKEHSVGISSLEEFEANNVKKIIGKLKGKSVFTLEEVMGEFPGRKEYAKILEERGVNSAVCAPILNTEEEIIGIGAFENPKKNLDKVWILESLAIFVSDFLEKNNTVEYLKRLSFYDTLTEIKNRHSYREELKKIEESSLYSLGVAYIDINGLSKINEAKGTRYGDELIKKTARILAEVFGENVYRVGGDEFIVLEKDLDEVVFEGKIASLKNRISQNESLKVSIGFTWNTNIDDAENEEDVVEFQSLWGNSSYSTLLRKNLDKEIKSGKFKVYLQPQIDLATNKIDGAEGLVRRLDASGNIQYPLSFIPFYEKEGLVSKIDLFVFDTLCKLINKWEKEGVIPESFKLSVNCSRTTIMEKDIVKTLLEICNKHSVSTSRLIIEITETINQADDRVFSYIVSSLKNAGFLVSLDDFGSGHANLFALKLSDFDEIKIDMGLTSDLHLDNKSRVLTKVALDLCKEFEGMVSVAEGIETVEQRDILRELNCKKGQGYYFSRPISVEDFEEKYFKETNSAFISDKILK